MPKRQPVWKQLVTDRDYRRFAVLFIVNGAGSSAGLPLVPLFLTQELHASLAEVGVLTVTGLLVIVAGPFVGKFSDRTGHRRQIMSGLALLMAAGWAVYPFLTTFWAAIAVQVVLLGWVGVVNAQVFAGLSETLDRRGSTDAATITSTLRGGYSLGFMIGPLISTTLVALVSLRAAFGLAVVVYLAVAVLAWRVPVTDRHAESGAEPKPKGGKGAMLPLLIFATGACLVIVGDMLRAIYMPILVVEELDHSEAMFGALISVTAGLEIALFPFVGKLADRFGVHKVMMVGLVFGIAAYVVLATSTHIWQVWLFTVLDVVIFTVTMGLGVTYAQSLAPGQSGLAASVFFSAQTAAKPVSGVLVALSIGGLGLPGIFWLPAGLCALCLLALAVTSRQTKRREPAESTAAVG